MTQKELLKFHFKRNKSITQLSATLLYGILRISERVREMERKGWVFDHVTVSKNKKRFTEYRLIKRGA